MYRSEINIKHSNRSHLYWGIDKATGEVVGIDDVRSRGLNCNCKCAACNGDFIARKGEKNKHHFAHQSNYECVYANEIAIYLFVKMVFASYQTIEAPEIPVKIGSRTEIAKNNWDARVGEVYYQCDPEQYPPLLVAELDNTPTRIILSFGKYYTEDDIVLLKQEACEKGWDCLSISFPRITEQQSINPDLMRLGVQGNIQGKTWIYNAREARWQHRLQENAVTPPQTMPASWGTAYECPIHKREREGRYYARPEDCSRCAFNYTLVPKCKCLAMNGIQHLRDIKLPIEQRMESIQKMQKENDERHLLIAQMQNDREQSLCRNQRNNKQFNPTMFQESALSVEERKYLDKQEILKRMERPSDDPVFDQFHVRWLMCTRCHEIKPSDEMASYGGRHSANMGICRECSRKHSGR